MKARANQPKDKGQTMAKMVKKGDLPEKICETCQKPFAWRKKWARDWETIRFCSHKCKSQGKRDAKQETRH